jgi:hypothetical protein
MTQYTFYHFAKQELMATAHYHVHVGQHEDLRQKALAMRVRFERGEATMTIVSSRE